MKSYLFERKLIIKREIFSVNNKSLNDRPEGLQVGATPNCARVYEMRILLFNNI